ncbi:NAD-dependent epimerase/dehydratase family protein [Billgrantia endophytica]|uniref:NAD(P)-dependent oxidoreductase n=1 Tax=Billgrantia endophytica TaxID=2033802 RepID=A0A2N7U2X2_9GAMM|nr:NAD-dependent epimerase/dehydratase family protein [Halomonas endophytica]PMR74763.1 NAD(P)-dependent oxidoreductase [Halomonas endophytica]
MKKTTLILGCGDIGMVLARELMAAGHRVIGARRSVSALEGSGIEPLLLDLSDEAALEKLPDADFVVYTPSADRFEEAAYRAAYLDGLKAVLSLYEGRKSAPQRILFVSSTSVYGQKEGELVDEESLAEAAGFSGVLMREAEQALHDSPIPGTAVRFSGIYGPGRDRLIRQVLEGRIAPTAPPMYSNRIHRDDCAGVLAHLIARSEAGQPLETLYLASDCAPEPLYDVMSWMAKRLKVEPTEVIQAPLRKRASKRCDNTRLLETGYTFRYPSYRDGYTQVMKEGGFLPEPV